MSTIHALPAPATPAAPDFDFDAHARLLAGYPFCYTAADVKALCPDATPEALVRLSAALAAVTGVAEHLDASVAAILEAAP